jgi:hypothetical protein
MTLEEAQICDTHSLKGSKYMFELRIHFVHSEKIIFNKVKKFFLRFLINRAENRPFLRREDNLKLKKIVKPKV